jgi:hypothetical protein
MGQQDNGFTHKDGANNKEPTNGTRAFSNFFS